MTRDCRLPARFLQRLGLLFALLLAGGCGGADPATAIVLDIISQFEVPAEMNRLRVVVRGAHDTTALDSTFELGTGPGKYAAGTEGESAWSLGRLALVPQQGKQGQVHVLIEGLFFDEVKEQRLVSRSATVSFLPDHRVLLPMPLVKACLGKVCPTGKTCVVSGSCDDELVDETSLPRYEKSPPPATTIEMPSVGRDAGSDSAPVEVGPVDAREAAAVDTPLAPPDGPAGDGQIADRHADSPGDGPDEGGPDSGPDQAPVPACGNGRLDPGELCDPMSTTAPCPTACPRQRCEQYRLMAGDTCQARCVLESTVTACMGGDNCCPTACNGNNDNDCNARCDNGVVEATETCDPVSNCMQQSAACVSDADNEKVRSGSVSDCSFVCRSTPRPCQAGDGFCPTECNHTNDGDCKKPGGVACTGASECASGTCTDGRCCTMTCSTCQACTGAGGTCVNLPAASEDSVPANACTGASACDGAGGCKRKNGQSCTAAGSCLSGFCADGYCCNQACTASCRTCGRSGSQGQCVTVTGAVDPGACDGGNICNPAGVCGTCGTNTVEGGEECDDGNFTNGDGCSADCKREARCGDGKLNVASEQCDDGNLNGGDGCTSMCKIEPGWMCLMPGHPCMPTPAALSATPGMHDFGVVTVGETSTSATFTISNNGGAASGPLMAQVSPAFIMVANTCTSQTLAPGASCTVQVAYTPVSPGATSGSLTVGDMPGASVQVPLNGTGQ